MNSVVLVGRVGQDPEQIKYIMPKGEQGEAIAVVNFSIAVNRWNAKTKAREADWFNVQLWGKKAETYSEWVKKGALISVEGKIALDRWQTPDGETAEKYYIKAKSFEFVGGKNETQTVAG